MQPMRDRRRVVHVPDIDWSTVEGRSAVVPVKVTWLELQLTDGQIRANAMARAKGYDDPFPDRSVFDVVIPRPYAHDEERTR